MSAMMEASGKTTLISQLAGEVRQDSGEIFFDGRSIGRLSKEARCKAGISRTFQTTNIFKEFSALENVALSAQIARGHGFRFWRPFSSYRTQFQKAEELLGLAGLGDRSHVRVGSMSYGEQRALEIAMALATQPRLILLDEPTAGMGSSDARSIIDLLRSLKRRVTIVLIEHDMDAVFALADRITVLVYGRVVATDYPDAIACNEEVRRAYLGESRDAA